MKKNKGFTLIELVAIIVILVAIFLVAFPILLGTTKKTQNSKSEVDKDIVCDAGKTYIYSRVEEFPQLSNSGAQILLKLSKLVEYGVIDLDITDTQTDGTLIYTVENDGSLRCDYNPNIIVPPITDDDCVPGLVYNGQPQELLRNRIPDVVYTNYIETDAGVYTITALIDENSGVEWDDYTTVAKSITCSIERADDEIEVVPTLKVYDKRPIEPEITTKSGLTTSNTFYSDSTCTTTSSAIDVGTYYVIATTVGNGNYKPASSGCKIGGTISPASLVPRAVCQDKIYDATTAAVCSLSVETVMSGDDIVVKTHNCTFSDKNAASNKTVTCTNITAGDANTNNNRYRNYELLTSTTTTTATISKRNVDPPINLNIATTGVITWDPPTTPNPPGITNPTGYEISFNNGVTYITAISGTNYWNSLAGSEGEKKVLIRSVNSDTTNFNTPSAAAEVRTNVYTITVNSTNGTISPSPSVVRVITGTSFTTSGQTISIPQSGGTATTFTATKQDANGYTTTWDKWSETSGTLTSNKTITAIFTRTPIDYTITYNYNSATTVPNNRTTYNIETPTFTLTNPARVGYQFRGWSGTGLTGDTNTTVSINKGSTGNREYTANWTPNTYYVRFNKNNSSATGSMSNQTFRYDTAQNLTSNAYSLVGRTFNGWSTNADGTGTSYTNGQSVNNLTTTNNATVDLYAKWKPNTYTIHYDANYGSGAPADQTYDYDPTATTTLSSTEPTRNAYVFAGWSEDSNASTATYRAGATFPRSRIPSNGSTITLYAVWTYAPEMTCAVSGTIKPGTGTLSYGLNGYLVTDALVTCSCDAKGGTPSSITIGTTVITNLTKNGDVYTATYRVKEPGMNVNISATCDIAGIHEPAETGANNYYRPFSLLYMINGAERIGTSTANYQSAIQYLAANKTNDTSGDKGSTIEIPEVKRTSSFTYCGSACGVVGWDLQEKVKTATFAYKNTTVNLCTSEKSWCSDTPKGSSPVSSGTIALGEEFEARKVFAISWGRVAAPKAITGNNTTETGYFLLPDEYNIGFNVTEVDVETSTRNQYATVYNTNHYAVAVIKPLCSYIDGGSMHEQGTDQLTVVHAGGAGLKYTYNGYTYTIMSSPTSQYTAVATGSGSPPPLGAIPLIPTSQYNQYGFWCSTWGGGNKDNPNDPMNGWNLTLHLANGTWPDGTTGDRTLKMQYGSRDNNKLASTNIPTRSGYAFVGFDSGSTRVYDASGNNTRSGPWANYTTTTEFSIWYSTNNMTVTAAWIHDASVGFNPDYWTGGQHPVQVGGFSKTMKYGTRNNSSVTEATTYNREGYTLQGWYTEKNCAGTKVFDSSGKAVYASGYWSASYSSGGVWRYNPSDHGGIYTVSLYACWVAN